MSPVAQTPLPLSDQHATPRWLFDHFNAEFGFTLDGAARAWNAKVEKYCTDDEYGYDGLEADWRGEVVWLNPPFSNLGAWMAKAYRESLLGATVVCLVPCVPDRKWWSESVEGKATSVRMLTRSLLPSGRVHFEREDGSSGRAPFPSCLVIYWRAA